MAQCETWGNDYDKAFDIVMADTSHTFDSFECAVQAADNLSLLTAHFKEERR